MIPGIHSSRSVETVEVSTVHRRLENKRGGPLNPSEKELMDWVLKQASPFQDHFNQIDVQRTLWDALQHIREGSPHYLLPDNTFAQQFLFDLFEVLIHSLEGREALERINSAKEFEPQSVALDLKHQWHQFLLGYQERNLFFSPEEEAWMRGSQEPTSPMKPSDDSPNNWVSGLWGFRNLGWFLNIDQLNDILKRILGLQEVPSYVLSHVYYLADRISRIHEAGSSRHHITRDKIEMVAFNALRALKGQEFHYLNQLPKQVAQAALLALNWLVWNETGNAANQPLVVDSNKKWGDFLSAFAYRDKSFVSRVKSRSRQNLENAKDIGRSIIDGPRVSLTQPGDTLDIRITSLLKAAIELAKRAQPSWEEQARQFIESKMAKRVLPISETSLKESIAIVENLLTGHQTERELLDAARYEEHYRAFYILLFYLSTYGNQRLAKQASEALVLLGTNIYRRRAEAPISEFSERAPNIDGKDPEAIVDFLKSLGLDPIHEEDLQIFQAAFNQNEADPSMIRMDLDKNSLEYSFKRWGIPGLGMFIGDFPRTGIFVGREEVWVRKIMLMSAALVLKHQTSEVVISHTIPGRMVDMINHPDLAIFKFAYFGRMPEDPPVTVEEINELHTGFEGLAAGEIGYLRDYLKEGAPVHMGEEGSYLHLDPVTNYVLARAMVGPFHGPREASGKVKGFLKDLKDTFLMIRGQKSYAIIESKKQTPRAYVLADDNRSNAIDWIATGGAGAIQTPKKTRHWDKRPDGMSPLEGLLQIVRRARGKSDSSDPIILPVVDTVLPKKVVVIHRDWVSKTYFGWLVPIVQLVWLKIQIQRNLLLNKRLRAFRLLAKELVLQGPPVSVLNEKRRKEEEQERAKSLREKGLTLVKGEPDHTVLETEHRVNWNYSSSSDEDSLPRVVLHENHHVRLFAKAKPPTSLPKPGRMASARFFRQPGIFRRSVLARGIR